MGIFTLPHLKAKFAHNLGSGFAYCYLSKNFNLLAKKQGQCRRSSLQEQRRRIERQKTFITFQSSLGFSGMPWTNPTHQLGKLLKNRLIQDNVEFPVELKPQFPLDRPHGFELPICNTD